MTAIEWIESDIFTMYFATRHMIFIASAPAHRQKSMLMDAAMDLVNTAVSHGHIFSLEQMTEAIEKLMPRIERDMEQMEKLS